jgi:ABC-type uncharacterized transport system ATPase subunit
VKYAQPVRFSLPGITPVKTKAEGAAGSWSAASFEVDTERNNLSEVIQALTRRGEVLDLTVEDEPLESIIAGIYEAQDSEEAPARAVEAAI